MWVHGEPYGEESFEGEKTNEITGQRYEDSGKLRAKHIGGTIRGLGGQEGLDDVQGSYEQAGEEVAKGEEGKDFVGEAGRDPLGDDEE